MLNDLSYAPEIASLSEWAMLTQITCSSIDSLLTFCFPVLVRQQAAATVDARKLIVTGAVASTQSRLAARSRAVVFTRALYCSCVRRARRPRRAGETECVGRRPC